MGNPPPGCDNPSFGQPKSMNNVSEHPTEPGPFQKYLFSGACYVSIGQCYARFVELLERDAAPAAMAELHPRLVEIWQEAFGQQMALAGGLLENPLAGRQPGLDRAMRGFQEEVLAQGREAMESFLETLAGHREHVPDFPEFFQAWAEACDLAYGNLVRSDPFTEMIGLVVNGCIDLAAAGQDP